MLYLKKKSNQKSHLPGGIQKTWKIKLGHGNMAIA
jgi:hypothetical protein